MTQDIARCSNCGKDWPREELTEVKDFWTRVSPGEIMPAGECPDCGALAHIADPEGRVMVAARTTLKVCNEHDLEQASVSIVGHGGLRELHLLAAAEVKKREAKTRLEYLRGELRAERISYGELAELQGLADYIDKDDVELLEAAGVPEHAMPTVGAVWAASQDIGEGDNWLELHATSLEAYKAAADRVKKDSEWWDDAELDRLLSDCTPASDAEAVEYFNSHCGERGSNPVFVEQIDIQGLPDKPLRVVVHVEGGLVQDVETPAGVVVEVRDYDCEGCDEETECLGYGEDEFHPTRHAHVSVCGKEG